MDSLNRFSATCSTGRTRVGSIWVSVAVAGFATVGLGFISHYWHLMLLFGVLFSSAMGSASFGILGPLAARWFLKRRALVLSLLIAIPSMGSLFSPPISSLVIAYFSWRGSFDGAGRHLAVLGASIGLQVSAQLALGHGTKARRGTRNLRWKYGCGEGPLYSNGAGLRSNAVGGPFRSRSFWALALVFAIGGFTEISGSIIFESFARDSLRLGPETITVSHVVMAVLGPVGAVAVGLVADRFARKRILGALFLAQGSVFWC